MREILILTNYQKFILKLFLFVVSSSFLYRLLFLFFHSNQVTYSNYDLITSTLVTGIRFDIRLGSFIVLPILLVSWIPFVKIQSKLMSLIKFYIYIVSLIVLSIFLIDLYYFEYSNNRIDASIIGLLKNTLITFNVFIETYPVAILIVLFILFHLLISKVIKYLVHKVLINEKKISKMQSIKANIFLFILIICLGYGKFSRYPLRWSDAFQTKNHFTNQLSLNPVLYVFNTYSWRNDGYDLEKVKQYKKILNNNFFLEQGEFAGPLVEKFSKSKLSSNPNIVIIFLETFPSYLASFINNPLNMSPFIDSLSKKSIVFNNFYVPKFSTAASIFSALTGIPDVSVINKSSTRDPYAINQDILINQLEDYKKHFFIGGSINWGDLGGFLRNNIKDINIHEEGDYNYKETNSWGISDYHLMLEMNDALKKEKEPFIAIALTAGHHPPFTIPEKVQGFNNVKFEDIYYENGFANEKQLNAFRFMDFSIKSFFLKAKKEEYYNNTLFVLLGDHGMSHPKINSENGSIYKQYFQVPLLFYYPNFIDKPITFDHIVSEIDLLPSIFSLLNKKYKNRNLGRNIFNPNYKNSQYAFIFQSSGNSYGLITKDNILMKRSKDNYEFLYKTKDLKTNDSLNKILEGIYETSRFLRYDLNLNKY